jgi:hypothetical protein
MDVQSTTRCRRDSTTWEQVHKSFVNDRFGSLAEVQITNFLKIKQLSAYGQ